MRYFTHSSVGSMDLDHIAAAAIFLKLCDAQVVNAIEILRLEMLDKRVWELAPPPRDISAHPPSRRPCKSA